MSEIEIVSLLESNFWIQLVLSILAFIVMMIFILFFIRNKEEFKKIKIIIICLLMIIGIINLEKSVAIGYALKNKSWIIENDVVVGYSSRSVPKSHAPSIKVTYFKNHQSYRNAPLDVNSGDSVEILIVPGYLGTDHMMAINPIEKQK